MDGVLANFDKRAEQILGTKNIYKYEFIWGAEVYWRELNSYPDFFLSLEAMPDAAWLLRETEYLDPIVLTALPKTNKDRVEQQKRAWIEMNIGPHMQVITCETKDKPNYCRPGDILVDDRAVNKPAWLARGGRYIVHTSAEDTLEQLYEMGVLEK